MLGGTGKGLIAMAIQHGLGIIGSLADVVTGAQKARAEAAVQRVLEGTDPRWIQFHQVSTADPLPRGRAWCRDCGEPVENHPLGITAFCDQCTEERRASWL